MQGHGSDRKVFRITAAQSSLTEDVRGRQRRYVISMTIRTICVILAAVLWNVERPFAWGVLVAGAILPYIAVVIANAGRENAPTVPGTLLPPGSPAELTSRSTVERDSENLSERH